MNVLCILYATFSNFTGKCNDYHAYVGEAGKKYQNVLKIRRNLEGARQISLFLEIKILKVQVSKLIIRSEDDTKRFRIFSIDIEENVKQ